MTKDILISGGLSSGGVGTHTAILCSVLRRAGANVTVCSTRSQWALKEIEQLKSIGIQVVVPRFGKLQALTTWPILFSRRFDLVYCVGHGKSHRLARICIKKNGKTIYHEVLACPSVGSIMDKLIPGMTSIVANSQMVGKEIQERWPTKQVSIIPFLTSNKRCDQPEQRNALGKSELRVVYLGRLAPHKRPQKLIEEWRSICSLDSISPARLDIFGDDQDKTLLPRLRAQVVAQRLDNQVTLHGAYDHSHVSRILSNADLVVLPSEWEGLPLVLVEAMQHGVPIVATAVGGTAELAEHNPDVVITEPNWESFVDGLVGMATLLRAGEIHNKRLHHWTESRYGYEAVSTQWLDCFGLKTCDH